MACRSTLLVFVRVAAVCIASLDYTIPSTAARETMTVP